MMCVKVVTAFRDKYTDECYSVDDLLTVSEARGKELIEAGVAVTTKKQRRNKKAKA